MAHDVFVSHSSKDKITADALCHALEGSGISCWIAPRDVRAGFDYPSEIMFGIENCRLMVLIFSEESNNSPFVFAEVERAFSKGKMIIPYRLSQIEMNRNLEFILSGKHWIDAYPNDTLFTDVISAVKNALGMPSVPSVSRASNMSTNAICDPGEDLHGDTLSANEIPANEDVFLQALKQLQGEEDCLVYIVNQGSSRVISWNMYTFYASGIVMQGGGAHGRPPSTNMVKNGIRWSYDMYMQGGGNTGQYIIKNNVLEFTLNAKINEQNSEFKYKCKFKENGDIEYDSNDKSASGAGLMIYCGTFIDGFFNSNDNYDKLPQ